MKSNIWFTLSLIAVIIYAVEGILIVFNVIPLDDLSFENMCWICSPVPFVVFFGTMYLVKEKQL
jgi:hypothetical protein